MQPVRIIGQVAHGATRVVRHPVSSAAYAVGMVRGLAGVVVRGGTVTDRDPGTGPVPAPRPAVGPDAAPPPAAPPRAPAPPGESFVTEPTAVSRESAHGRFGADAEIDDWEAEALDEPDIDIETPVDTAEADVQQPGTEPLLDPGTAKAIRSESVMMRKAADSDPE